MYRSTVAEISKSALESNIELLKGLHENRQFFCPMVKANAYGHDDLIVSKILEPYASHFGVVLIEEGIKVRKNSSHKPILVFGNFVNEKCIQACMDHNLTPVISSFDFLKVVQSFDKNNSFKIHIKLDTGMTRLGFQLHQISQLKTELSSLKNIKVEGICTHFLMGEDVGTEDGYTLAQFQKFTEVEKQLKGLYEYSHCLNSAALLNQMATLAPHQSGLEFMGARPGVAMYGYQPQMIFKNNHRLKPVMTLKSQIVQKKKIAKDQAVSYGAMWKARRETDMAIVGIGYADGLFRALSNQTEMIVHGQKVPLIGRICMDYCMVDLTDHPQKDAIPIGAPVVVWGTDGNLVISLDDLANKTNTISYEYMTRVGPRVPRLVVE